MFRKPPTNSYTAQGIDTGCLVKRSGHADVLHNCGRVQSVNGNQAAVQMAGGNNSEPVAIPIDDIERLRPGPLFNRVSISLAQAARSD
jgi:hypothetical protein